MMIITLEALAVHGELSALPKDLYDTSSLHQYDQIMLKLLIYVPLPVYLPVLFKM